MAWNEGMDALLKNLYKKHVPMGAIARDINEAFGSELKRSAVSGRIRRLGLTHNPQGPRGPKAPALPARRPGRPVGSKTAPELLAIKRRHRVRARLTEETAAAWVPPPLPEATKPLIESKPCDLFSLTSHTCRWPLWGEKPKPEEKLFCGAPVVEGARIGGECFSYCAEHQAKSLSGYTPWGYATNKSLIHSRP